MSQKVNPRHATVPVALAGLNALRESLEQKYPSFRAAKSDEQAAETFCRHVRDLLQERRKAMKVDQKEMGRRLNLSQSAISKIETGRGDLSLKTLHRYVTALGLQPTVFFSPTARTLAEEFVEEFVQLGNAAAIAGASTQDLPTKALQVGTALASVVSANLGAQFNAQEHFVRQIAGLLPEIAKEVTEAT
jgi:transcriptional regulator with XRE-family HTH domain